MKKTGYVAGILFSVVTTSFVGRAVGAPGEPSQLEQAEELSTTSEESRCPFQQTVNRMVGVFVDDITLDYQGQALRIRVLGSDDGLSIMGFDRRVPYLELGRFELQDDSFWCDVNGNPKDRASSAVEEMRVGPSKPACRSWLQTRQCCCGPKDMVVSDC